MLENFYLLSGIIILDLTLFSHGARKHTALPSLETLQVTVSLDKGPWDLAKSHHEVAVVVVVVVVVVGGGGGSFLWTHTYLQVEKVVVFLLPENLETVCVKHMFFLKYADPKKVPMWTRSAPSSLKVFLSDIRKPGKRFQKGILTMECGAKSTRKFPWRTPQGVAGICP